MAIQAREFPSAATKAHRTRVETSIVISAYNEEAGLPEVLGKLSRVIDGSYEVIVVDDGSTDGTARVAKEFACRVIRHRENLGKGAAMRSGTLTARGDKIIFLDADGQHPANLVPKIARLLDMHDMAVACRTQDGGNLSRIHRIGNFVLGNLIRRVYHYKPHDPLTGFIGMKRSHLLHMKLDSTGFTVETEIAIKSASMGLDVIDIPIPHRRRIGKVKLRGLRDGYQILQTVIRMLALYNPNITFTVPGGLLFLAGVTLMTVLMVRPITAGNVGLGIHSFVLASMLSLAGFQLGIFGFAMKAYALTYKFTKHDLISRLLMRNHMAKVVFGLGGLMALIAFSLGTWVGVQWASAEPVPFDQAKALILFAFLWVLGLDAASSAAFLAVFLRELGKASKLGSPQGT